MGAPREAAAAAIIELIAIQKLAVEKPNLKNPMLPIGIKAEDIFKFHPDGKPYVLLDPVLAALRYVYDSKNWPKQWPDIREMSLTMATEMVNLSAVFKEHGQKHPTQDLYVYINTKEKSPLMKHINKEVLPHAKIVREDEKQRVFATLLPIPKYFTEGDAYVK